MRVKVKGKWAELGYRTKSRPGERLVQVPCKGPYYTEKCEGKWCSNCKGQGYTLKWKKYETG